MKAIYKHIANGYIVAIITNNGEKIAAPETVESFWNVYDIAARYGARLEEH